MVVFSFRWQPPLPLPSVSPIRPFPVQFPPFRYGRRGWRLRLRPPFPGFSAPPALPRSSLPAPLRTGLLGLGSFRFRHLRRTLPSAPLPPPLPLFAAPFRLRRRPGVRPLLPFPPLLPLRLLPFRRRRGVRRWLLPPLSPLLGSHFRLAPLSLYGRRRTPRRLRPLFTLAVLAGRPGRLPPLGLVHPPFFSSPSAFRLATRRPPPLPFRAPTG